MKKGQTKTFQAVLNNGGCLDSMGAFNLSGKLSCVGALCKVKKSSIKKMGRTVQRWYFKKGLDLSTVPPPFILMPKGKGFELHIEYQLQTRLIKEDFESKEQAGKWLELVVKK